MERIVRILLSGVFDKGAREVGEVRGVGKA